MRDQNAGEFTVPDLSAVPLLWAPLVVALGVAVAVFAALGVTLAIAPLVRGSLVRAGMLDNPNARSSHVIPTPRGGGIACAFGIVVAAVLMVAFGLAHYVPWVALGAGLVLALVGRLDDVRGLSASARLLSQAGVGAATGFLIGGTLLWAVLGVIVMSVCVNAANFMDGINGISAFTAALWGATAIYVGASTADAVIFTLGALVLGAAIGFLPWNAPSAQMFLGDTGSYLLGALYAAGVLNVAVKQPTFAPLIIAPLSVYLMDTGWTLASRILHREKIGVAHRDHAYQRLVHRCGHSHLEVSLFATAMAVLVVVATSTQQPYAYLVIATTLLIYELAPALRGSHRSWSAHRTERSGTRARRGRG